MRSERGTQSANAEGSTRAGSAAPPNLMDLLFDELAVEEDPGESPTPAAGDLPTDPAATGEGPLTARDPPTKGAAKIESVNVSGAVEDRAIDDAVKWAAVAASPVDDDTNPFFVDDAAPPPSLSSKELGSKSSALSWEDFQGARDPASRATSRRVMAVEQGAALSQSFNLLGLEGDSHAVEDWNPFSSEASPPGVQAAAVAAAPPQVDTTNPFLVAVSSNPFEVPNEGLREGQPASLAEGGETAWNPFV